MAARPRPPPTGLFTLGRVFKLVAITLVVVNVLWHGLVALFVGGPFGLVLFLTGVISMWTWSWFTMRRWRAVYAAEFDGPSDGAPPVPLRPSANAPGPPAVP